MKKLLSIVSLVISGACAIACACGGAPGNNNRLIFGSGVSYQGVDSMSAPAAAGSKLVVFIEGSHGATAAESVAVSHLTLRVERDGEHGSAAPSPSEVTEMGPGRWLVTVPTVGSYRLVAANEAGTAVDTFDMRAVAPEAISFDDAVTVVTRGTRASGTSCEVRSEASLRTLVLRENQEAHVVTVAAAGETRLAGMLDLAATSSSEGVTLRAVAASETIAANATAVSLRGAHGGTIELAVSERATGRGATTRIATAAGDAPVECPTE